MDRSLDRSPGTPKAAQENKGVLQEVSVVSGSLRPGYKDGAIAEALFNSPVAITPLFEGKSLLLAESQNNVLRLVSIAEKKVSTFCKGTSFLAPRGLTVCKDGILVCDSGHNRIRLANFDGSKCSLFAGSGKKGFRDGRLTEAKFDSPSSICCSSDGSVYYVADTNNHRIRCINVLTKEVTTLNNVSSTSQFDEDTHSIVGGTETAGYRDGPLPEALFNGPTCLILDLDGGILICDTQNHCIRKITKDLKYVFTIAGVGEVSGHKDGVASDALFSSPESIALSADGSVYIADTNNHCIRRLKNGVVSTFAGSKKYGMKNGLRSESRFTYPRAVCVHQEFAKDHVYIADTGNFMVRKFFYNTSATNSPAQMGDSRLGTRQLNTSTTSGSNGRDLSDIDMSGEIELRKPSFYELLQQEEQNLKAVFQYYTKAMTSNTEVNELSVVKFFKFVKDCNLIDNQRLTPAYVYIIFAEATKYSPSFRMNFDEFLSALCLIAVKKFAMADEDIKNVLDLSEYDTTIRTCLRPLLFGYVFPYAQKETVEHTSADELSEREVIKLFSKHEQILFKIFSFYASIKRPPGAHNAYKRGLNTMNIEEFFRFSKDFEIFPNLFSKAKLVQAYHSSFSGFMTNPNQSSFGTDIMLEQGEAESTNSPRRSAEQASDSVPPTKLVFDSEITEADKMNDATQSMTRRTKSMTFGYSSILSPSKANDGSANQSRAMSFYDFLECLGRLAIMRYSEPPLDTVYQTTASKIEALLEHMHLSKGRLKFTSTVGSQLFRGLQVKILPTGTKARSRAREVTKILHSNSQSLGYNATDIAVSAIKSIKRQSASSPVHNSSPLRQRRVSFSALTSFGASAVLRGTPIKQQALQTYRQPDFDECYPELDFSKKMATPDSKSSDISSREDVVCSSDQVKLYIFDETNQTWNYLMDCTASIARERISVTLLTPMKQQPADSTPPKQPPTNPYRLLISTPSAMVLTEALTDVNLPTVEHTELFHIWKRESLDVTGAPQVYAMQFSSEFDSREFEMQYEYIQKFYYDHYTRDQAKDQSIISTPRSSTSSPRSRSYSSPSRLNETDRTPRGSAKKSQQEPKAEDLNKEQHFTNLSALDDSNENNDLQAYSSSQNKKREARIVLLRNLEKKYGNLTPQQIRQSLSNGQSPSSSSPAKYNESTALNSSASKSLEELRNVLLTDFESDTVSHKPTGGFDEINNIEQEFIVSLEKQRESELKKGFDSQRSESIRKLQQGLPTSSSTLLPTSDSEMFTRTETVFTHSSVQKTLRAQRDELLSETEERTTAEFEFEYSLDGYEYSAEERLRSSNNTSETEDQLMDYDPEEGEQRISLAEQDINREYAVLTANSSSSEEGSEQQDEDDNSESAQNDDISQKERRVFFTSDVEAHSMGDDDEVPEEYDQQDDIAGTAAFESDEHYQNMLSAIAAESSLHSNPPSREGHRPEDVRDSKTSPTAAGREGAISGTGRPSSALGFNSSDSEPQSRGSTPTQPQPPVHMLRQSPNAHHDLQNISAKQRIFLKNEDEDLDTSQSVLQNTSHQVSFSSDTSTIRQHQFTPLQCSINFLKSYEYALSAILDGMVHISGDSTIRAEIAKAMEWTTGLFIAAQQGLNTTDSGLLPITTLPISGMSQSTPSTPSKSALLQFASHRIENVLRSLVELDLQLCTRMSKISEFYDAIRLSLPDNSLYTECYMKDSWGSSNLCYKDHFCVVTSEECSVSIFLCGKDFTDEIVPHLGKVSFMLNGQTLPQHNVQFSYFSDKRAVFASFALEIPAIQPITSTSFDNSQQTIDDYQQRIIDGTAELDISDHDVHVMSGKRATAKMMPPPTMVATKASALNKASEKRKYSPTSKLSPNSRSSPIRASPSSGQFLRQRSPDRVSHGELADMSRPVLHDDDDEDVRTMSFDLRMSLQIPGDSKNSFDCDIPVYLAIFHSSEAIDKVHTPLKQQLRNCGYPLPSHFKPLALFSYRKVVPQSLNMHTL